MFKNILQDAAMPHPADRAARTRERILASAYRLFITQGYDNTSIDDIMQDCALTRGGFYAHFDSKGQLYAEAILHAAQQSRLAGGKPEGVSARSWLRQLLASYLDRDRCARNDWPCPLAFLATDVTRREPEIRNAYTRAFASMNAHILELARTCSDCDEGTVLAVAAMLVGAVAVARTLEDQGLRERMLEASERMAARQLGLERRPQTVAAASAAGEPA